ncbi:hypothetical protein IMAU80053_02467 [Lactiplantibacillus plantarum]|nr:hypothetical protein [Lactiplantibacillus plantarum]
MVVISANKNGHRMGSRLGILISVELDLFPFLEISCQS